ncbi:hypothetical protein NUM_49930 [Actinocatenispora comari]|uniref:DUF501 domain-containing protein n=1 Tax=Actinocatenispora comari TaxID=2807577 RepID=A0A8J4EQE5_9ACTN|nr:hypothetical protein NUM_49930 [Actinocatenispora comari]
MSAAESAGPPVHEPVTPVATAAMSAQLGRPLRGAAAVAHRCPCGNPDVVQTSPRLPDGTPFPTLFYLTCPRAAAEVSRLESAGTMREMTERLADDPDLAGRYQEAHRDYLRRRAELAEVPEIAGVSAGGMPTRVKCLHVHVAHALATGPGVNPFGDEALATMAPWWADGPCVCADDPPGEDDGAAMSGDGPDHGRASGGGDE